MNKSKLLLALLFVTTNLSGQINYYCEVDTVKKNADTLMITSYCNYYYSYFRASKDSIVSVDDLNNSINFSLKQVKTEYYYNIKDKKGSLTYCINDTILIERYEIKNNYVEGKGYKYSNLIRNNNKILEKAKFKKNNLHGFYKSYHFDRDEIFIKAFYFYGYRFFYKKY